MDYFKFIDIFANYGILGIIAIFYIKTSSENSKRIIKLLTELKDELKRSVGNTLLTYGQTLRLLDISIYKHIDLIVNHVRNILIKNDLKKRKIEITKNIASYIYRITQIKSDKLSEFNTPLGNIGTLLITFIDFNKFNEEIDCIVFKEDTVENKCNDLRTFMYGCFSEFKKTLTQKV